MKSFNDKIRDKSLNKVLFDTTQEKKMLVETRSET